VHFQAHLPRLVIHFASTERDRNGQLKAFKATLTPGNRMDRADIINLNQLIVYGKINSPGSSDIALRS
jgi:hypothetical protein